MSWFFLFPFWGLMGILTLSEILVLNYLRREQYKDYNKIFILIMNLVMYFALARGSEKFQIIPDLDLVIYLMKYSYLLKDDISILWEDGKWYYVFIFVLGILGKRFIMEKSKNFPLRMVLIPLLLIVLLSIGMPIWKEMRNEEKEENSEKKNQTGERIEKTNRKNIVVFLLESVSSEHYQKVRSRYFHKDIPNTQRVENFFTPVPHSSFAIYSILTGLYAEGNQKPNYKRNLDRKNYYKEYDKYFFYTQPAGVENLDEFLDDMGFEWMDKVRYKKVHNYAEFSWGVEDSALLDSAIQLIQKRKETIKKNNFFAIFAFSQTHSPYFCKQKEENARKRHACALQEDLDIVDRIMEKWENESEFQNTIFLLTSDHGESFGEYGFLKHDFSLYNQEIKIPFYVYSKEKIAKLRNYGSVLDIYPSFFQNFSEDFSQKGDGDNMFLENPNWNLKIRSWGKDFYRGRIRNGKKYLFNNVKNELWEMDYFDSHQKQIILDKQKILKREIEDSGKENKID